MGEMKCFDVGFGDTTLIDSGSGVVMIDCNEFIEDHSSVLPRSKVIDVLFITHQHYDHFLGMEFLKTEGFTIRNLVYSPYDRRRSDNSVAYDEWERFKSIAGYFQRAGTKAYAPYRQKTWDSAWWSICGLKVWMIGPNEAIATSTTRELHDACLVFRIVMGNRKCLFTGDASDQSLSWIADHTNYHCEDILHASHHGSLNGADLDFIKSCNADFTVISTKPGVHQNVPHATALSRYENHTANTVYRTDRDGTLTWSF